MAEIDLVRGDIVLVDLSGAVGGEQKNDADSGVRPCLVVQNDGGNKASPLTIVAAIADARQYKGYPQQVLATGAELGPGGKDSVILLGHLRTIDRDQRIKKYLARAAPAVMTRVDAALKSSLGLK